MLDLVKRRLVEHAGVDGGKVNKFNSVIGACLIGTTFRFTLIFLKL